MSINLVIVALELITTINFTNDIKGISEWLINYKTKGRSIDNSRGI